MSAELSGPKPLRLAVLGDCATQFLVMELQEQESAYGLALEVYEAGYDQIVALIADSSSELYSFFPQAIVILQATEKLLAEFYQNAPSDRLNFADKILQRFRDRLEKIGSVSPAAQMILGNFVEIEDSILGNYANSTQKSFIYQLRKINLGLMNLATERSQLSILDLCALQSRVGRGVYYEPRFYFSASMAQSMEVIPLMARNICSMLAARTGQFKKCVILDLDNTLWGGVIGDDGLEKIEVGDLGRGKAFSAFQHWLKELKLRGILLAVCSKNEDKVAREPFTKHPDMVLRLDDLAVFVANWNSKADNIRFIQSQLNIGFDSMVFLDDNPFERNLVQKSLPEITIPELPEEPSEFLPYLQGLNLFETPGLSENDEVRTQQIQDKIWVENLQSQFATESEYLASLQMKLKITPFTPFNLPRVAQLSQRSNQFNLRTVRYTEEEVGRLTKDSGHLCLALSLHDNLADHGLISLIVVQLLDGELFIANWLMSCRVLKRGVESAALNHLVTLAERHHQSRIVGEYLPTKKNELVKDHYRNLGFSPAGENRWILEVASYTPRQNFITIEEQHD